MISVVIPTLNAAATLPATLLSIFDAAIDGFVGEVIVSDGGSSDPTRDMAVAAGASVIAAQRGRGRQLIAGAEAARKPWLLFLHADTVLAVDWTREAKALISKGESTAAAFRFKLDDSGLRPTLLEAFVSMRCKIFRLPYGDQGLLISRSLYDQLGGFAAVPLMEDVEFVRRIGRGRLTILNAPAITSAARFRRDGYFRRSARNLSCLILYLSGVRPERLLAYYG